MGRDGDLCHGSSRGVQVMKFWEAVEVARKMGKKISFK
jgi:hypothetical protein